MEAFDFRKDYIEQEWYLIVNIIFFLVSTITSVVILVFLCKRKHKQPLKRRSPLLITTTVIANYFFILTLTIQSVSYEACHMSEDSAITNNEYLKYTLESICYTACPTKGNENKLMPNNLVNLNCFMGFLQLSFCEPIAILPFYLRAHRIYQVFKLQAKNRKGRKITKAEYIFVQEKNLLRYTLYIVLAIFLLSCVFFFLPNVRSLYPSYNVGNCFLYDLGSDMPCSNVQKALDQNSFEIHMNATLAFLIVVNFIYNLLFLISIFNLRMIAPAFNIQRELIQIFIIWFVSSTIMTGAFLFKNDDTKVVVQIVEFWLLLRSLLTILVCSLKTLKETYSKNQDSLILPPNIDEINSIEMVLRIPIAAGLFSDFLDYKNDLDDTFSFGLFADLCKFEDMCKFEENSQKLKEFAFDIQGNYLLEGSDFEIKYIDPVIRMTIQQKLNTISKKTDEEARRLLKSNFFIELYAQVLNRLRYHFEEYQRSPQWTELGCELKKQFENMEILVRASQ